MYWLKTILQKMWICRGAEGMKRISVRIIQSLSDYPGNMELCQVEEVVIVGVRSFCLLPVWVCARAKSVPVRECVLLLWKAVAFCTLIEIISMRIEPSQRTGTPYDSPCVSFNSTRLSAFTFLALRTQSISLAATWKNQSKLSRRLLFHMKRINGWLSNWHFVREDRAVTFIVTHARLSSGNVRHLRPDHF